MRKRPIPLDVLTEAATMRSSTLYGWMLSNHDAFEAIVKEAVRPNWPLLAQRFGEYGLRDGSDAIPSGECARQTWWKVRKAVAARRAAAAKRSAAGKVAPVTGARTETKTTHTARSARSTPVPGARTETAATDLDALFAASSLKLPDVTR